MVSLFYTTLNSEILSDMFPGVKLPKLILFRFVLDPVFLVIFVLLGVRDPSLESGFL